MIHFLDEDGHEQKNSTQIVVSIDLLDYFKRIEFLLARIECDRVIRGFDERRHRERQEAQA